MRGLRALRLLRRHYVTLISFLVVGAVGALALTSHDFDVASGAVSENAPPEEQAGISNLAPPFPTVTPTLTGHRPLALVYLVTDDTQANKLTLTYSTLVWDTVLTDPEYTLHTPPVHVLVAGTPKAESAAIERLNRLIQAADMQGLDLRVVDLRSAK